MNSSNEREIKHNPNQFRSFFLLSILTQDLWNQVRQLPPHWIFSGPIVLFKQCLLEWIFTAAFKVTSSVIQASVSHRSSMWSNKNSRLNWKLKLCTVAIFCIFIFVVVLIRVLVIIPGPVRYLVSAFLFRVLVTERSIPCLRIDQFRSGPFRTLVIPLIKHLYLSNLYPHFSGFCWVSRTRIRTQKTRFFCRLTLNRIRKLDWTRYFGFGYGIRTNRIFRVRVWNPKTEKHE